MFIGQCQSKLDAKFRIKIPKKILKQIQRVSTAETLHITLGLEKCLFLFTVEGWLERERRMADVPITAGARKFDRIFFGNAEEVVPDSVGRFLIPEHLRRRFGDDKDLVFVGVKNRIEIWSAREWQAFNDDNEQDYESVAEEILR